MVSQLIVSINYLIWYLLFQYQADSALRIIELSQILVTLLALGLLPNRNVQIFLYGTILKNDKEEAADLYIYRISELKAIKIY